MKAKTDANGDRIKNIAQVYHGAEPKWLVSDRTLTARIGDAINWYSVSFNNSDFKSWVLTYFKKMGFDTNFDSDVLEHDFRACGMLIRMKEKGCPFDDEWDARFTSEIKKLRKRIKVDNVEVVEKSRYEKIQSTMAKRRAYTLGLIEALCDDILLGKIIITKLTNWETLKINIPANYMQDVSNRLDDHLGELEEVLEILDMKNLNSDQQFLKEGYSNFTKVQLTNYINSLQYIQNLCDAVIETAAAEKIKTPKIKKVKPVDVDKLVQFCSFKKDISDPVKFVGIIPKKIIGADQVIVYNTEKRVVTIFKASGENGLSVKGTTIIGFDEKSSIRKTVRKPEVFIPAILKSTKPSAKNLIKELVAKEQEASGRMSGETIILKVD